MILSGAVTIIVVAILFHLRGLSPWKNINDASGLSEDPVGRRTHAEEAALGVLPERGTSSLASR